MMNFQIFLAVNSFTHQINMESFKLISEYSTNFKNFSARFNINLKHYFYYRGKRVL